MKELTYTLEERPARKDGVIDNTQKPAFVMVDSEGYIVGIFSDKLEAEQAWPKIRYNLEKGRVNLKYATFKIVRPVQYVLFANKRDGQKKFKHGRK